MGTIIGTVERAMGTIVGRTALMTTSAIVASYIGTAMTGEASGTGGATRDARRAMTALGGAERLEATGATTVGFGPTTGAATRGATATISGSTRDGGMTMIPPGATGDGTMTGNEDAGGAMFSPH